MSTSRFGLGSLVVGFFTGGVLTLLVVDRFLRLDSEMSESLHSAADIAVIAAVVVAAIALFWQALDRREQRDAVDAYIRAVAAQTRRELHQARHGVAARDLIQRLSRRGTLPADLMATFFTSIVAQAPRASRPLGRAAREVCELFWDTISRAEEHLQSDTITGDVATELEKKLDRVEDLLKRAAEQ